jgi:hypothetical protein
MDIDYDRIDDRTLALRQWGIRPVPDEERREPLSRGIRGVLSILEGRSGARLVRPGSSCLKKRGE